MNEKLGNASHKSPDQEAFNRELSMEDECFLGDLFLGGQSSIILGYRRLSVKSLLIFHSDNRQAFKAITKRH